MHEILTLQFGPLANYVGTHFWNTQESYFTYNASEEPSIVDHDINFRPGIGSDGTDTYSPRALIYDLKSGFGSLRKINALYEIEDQQQHNTVWTGEQRLQTAPPVAPSPYQDALETGLPTFQVRSQDVRYWSDYNRVFFHPRSLIQLFPQSLTSQLSAFESYSAGIELYDDLNHETDGVFDRDVRPFAEECDSLQGFQVFGASDSAWGGFMSKYIEELEEDFGKKSIWTWVLEDGRRVERRKHLHQIANSTQTLSSLTEKVTACIRTTTVPSSMPQYINLDPASFWSTGALIASVIDSITLPIRLRAGTARPTRMAIMEDLLQGESHRKLWTLAARAKPNAAGSSTVNGTSKTRPPNGTEMHDTRTPMSFAQDSKGDGTDEGPNQRSFDLDFTPMLPSIQSVFPSLQSIPTQSTSQSHLFGLIESMRSGSHHSISPYNTVQQGRLRQSLDEETIVEIYQTPLPFPLLDSFPHDLFTFASNDSTPHSAGNTSDVSVAEGERRPVIDIDATLSTSSRTKVDLLSLRDLVVGRGGRMMNLVDANERETLYDDLTKLADCYTYGYEDDDYDEEENGQDD